VSSGSIEAPRTRSSISIRDWARIQEFLKEFWRCDISNCRCCSSWVRQ